MDRPAAAADAAAAVAAGGTVAGAADEEDAYTARIAKTGCAAENEAVLLCHADRRDWTKCRDEVKALRECFERYRRGTTSK